MTSPLVLLAMEAVKGRGGRDGIGECPPPSCLFSLLLAPSCRSFGGQIHLPTLI